MPNWRRVVKRKEARGNKARTPKNRERRVSFALRALRQRQPAPTKGAVRDKSKLGLMMADSQTSLRRPEGAEYLRRCCARQSTSGAGHAATKNGKLSSRLDNVILVKREDRPASS